ncbi:MAG: hypothetical protein IPP90_13225 [Gemmatimonadaceae bacterium]|nr:hypothetical protein [Gemmatimonadaceae bacterium]
MPAATEGQLRGAPSARARLAFAAGMAVLAIVYVYLRGMDDPQRKSDFDQVWYAAQAVWHHQNPYELIGIGKPFAWKWPFYYPLPAVVLVGPVGLLSVIAARCVFAGVSVGALAWCITRDGWARVPVFVSMSFLVSVQLVQWSPILTAALLAPSLSWIGVAKPNWAVAIMASASTPRIWKPLLAGVGILSVLAFILRPDWVNQWCAIVRTASHFRTPLLLPMGFLMLAALLRWRRPEARLLLAIACLPQTPGFYDAVMLFTIPRTLRQSLLLAAASYVVFFAMAVRGPWPSDAAWMSDIARFTLWFMYLPCVAMVLRRPNEGTLPVGGRLFAPATAVSS